MSYGGATWDTAGTLTVGAGNTFDVVDATEDGDVLFEVGWWKFTPATDARVALDTNVFAIVFTGADEASKVNVPPIDLTGSGGPVVWAHAGVEYHVQVGRHDTGPFVDTYTVDYSTTTLTRSPWNDSLRSEEGNVLVVGFGDLLDSNPAGYTSPLDWFTQVIDIRSGGRSGSGSALEAEVHVSEAASCIWHHAANGDTLSLGALHPGWTCPLLPTGPGEYGGTGIVNYSLDAVDTPGGPADSATAHLNLDSRALYFLPVRDNLQPNGVLPFPNKTDDGYPDAIGIEWDEPYVDVEQVEATVESTDGLTAFLRSGQAPSNTGSEWTPWRYGAVDGDIQLFPGGWADISDRLAGDGTWDGLAEYDPGPFPADEVALLAPLAALSQPANPSSGSSSGQPALRFTLRARRYRWVYEQTTRVVPPRRIRQRGDGLTGGARGIKTGARTRQAGNRTIGGIL
jgi:hypothetical protein